MTEIDDLRKDMLKAQAMFLEAQHKYAQAQWRLFNFRYKQYEERARAYDEQAHKDVSVSAWFQEVRPMCRDCRREITDIYDGHQITYQWGKLPMISCGKTETWW